MLLSQLNKYLPFLMLVACIAVPKGYAEQEARNHADNKSRSIDTQSGKVVEILSAKCGSCHKEKSLGGLSDITDLTKLLSTTDYIVKGHPSDSTLFNRITSSEDRMPPLVNLAGKPLDGLTKEEIEIIKNWITGLNNVAGSKPVKSSALDVIAQVTNDMAEIRKQGLDPNYARYLYLNPDSKHGAKEGKAIVDLGMNALSGSRWPTPTHSLNEKNSVLRVWLPSYGWTPEQFDYLAKGGAKSDFLNNKLLSKQALFDNKDTRFELNRLFSRNNSNYYDSYSNTPIADGYSLLYRAICENKNYLTLLRQSLLNRKDGNYSSYVSEEAYLNFIVPNSYYNNYAGSYDTQSQYAKDYHYQPKYFNDIASLIDFEGQNGKAIILKNSGVAIEHRAMGVVPILNDGVSKMWISHDFDPKEKVDLFNPSLYPPEHSTLANGHEIIFLLPNGFPAFLASGQGPERKLVTDVPTAFARDYREGHQRTISNPVSCFGCHANGFLPRNDERRDYQSKEKTLPQIYQNYLMTKAESEKLFTEQNKRVREAFAKATGLPANNGVLEFNLKTLENFCGGLSNNEKPINKVERPNEISY